MACQSIGKAFKSGRGEEERERKLVTGELAFPSEAAPLEFSSIKSYKMGPGVLLLVPACLSISQKRCWEYANENSLMN